MIETDDSNLRWVEHAACHDLEVSDFFVDAGHVISSKVRERCRGCPVRQQCVTRAYTQGYTSGYFGGISPGERRNRTLQEALQQVGAAAAAAASHGKPRPAVETQENHPT